MRHWRRLSKPLPMKGAAAVVACLCLVLQYAEGGCVTAENLEYCKEYNGKLISTRGDAKLLDKNAKMVADFLANNPAASEACKDATRRLACAMNGANGSEDDMNNCNDPGVVKKPTRKLCYEALDSCQSKVMLRQQCEDNFKDEV